jgi:hypothetical protein
LLRQAKNYFSRLGEKPGDFSRRSKDYVTALAAQMREAVRSRWKSFKEVKPTANTSHDVNRNNRAEPFFGPPATMPEKSPRISPGLREPKQDSRLPPPQKPTEAQIAKDTGSPTEGGRVSDTSKAEQTGSHQISSLKAEPASVEQPNKGPPRYLGNFEVVENSFVRDKPQDDAEIITTLQPGTRVRVESKTGKYLRVRSLNDPAVRGYVHEEDAFFERSK